MATQTLALNAISVVTTAYIVRTLGPLQYGEWAAAFSLVSTLQAGVTVLGLRMHFVRDVTRQPEQAATLLAEQLGLRLALGVLAAILASGSAVALGYPPVVVACTAIGAIWILLSVVGSTLGDVLQSLERFGTYSAVSVMAGLCVTMATVAAVFGGGGALALTVAYLAAPLVSAVLLWRQAHRLMPVAITLDWARARALLAASWLPGLSSIAFTLRERILQLLIPALMGFEQFGVFSAATIVADRLSTIPDAIATSFYPSVSRASHESAAAVAAPARAMLTLGIAACMPMAIAGAAIAQPVALLLLPRDAATAVTVIRVTVLGLPLLAFSSAMTFCLQASGHQDRASRVSIIGSAVSVVVSIAGVTLGGTSGASWALVARPAIFVVALLPAFLEHFPGVLLSVPWLRIAAASLLLAALCAFALGQDLVAALAIASAAGLVYIGALLGLGIFSRADITRTLARGRTEA